MNSNDEALVAELIRAERKGFMPLGAMGRAAKRIKELHKELDALKKQNEKLQYEVTFLRQKWSI